MIDCDFKKFLNQFKLFRFLFCFFFSFRFVFFFCSRKILSSLPNDTEKSYSEKDIGGGTKGGGSSGFGVRKAAVYNYNQFVSFMRSNGLQFLIRGHDTITDGYQLYFNARCLTISSASAKHSIVALIDGINEEIRILKVLNVDQAIKVKQEFL